MAGGAVLRAAAPLDRIPLFLRDGADLPIRSSS
jgi:alpha-D-xyloside xylohydrolase